MGIRDRNVEWARQRLYIPVWQFQGIIGDLVSASGTAVIAELTTTGLTALQCAAGDIISHVMEFPSFWDVTKEIGVRAIWTYDATAEVTDDVTWIVLFDQVDVGEAIIAPATVLDTTIANQDATSVTALTLMRSPRGIINANTFDVNALDGLFTFSIESDVVNGFTADEPHLLGVAFDYFPLLTIGGDNATLESRQ